MKHLTDGTRSVKLMSLVTLFLPKLNYNICAEFCLCKHQPMRMPNMFPLLYCSVHIFTFSIIIIIIIIILRTNINNNIYYKVSLQTD